jgi:hypothetical protein
MLRRPLLLSLAASLALTVGLVAGPVAPASADPVPVVVGSVDKTLAHPGETVTVTVTFTNPEAVPVTFSYLGVTKLAWVSGGLVEYSFTGCTGDLSWCLVVPPDNHTVSAHHSVTIAPGDTRTAAFTYEIAAGSPCGEGESLGLVVYSYRESSAGAEQANDYGKQLRTDVAC